MEKTFLENISHIKDYSKPADYFSEAVFKDGKKNIAVVEKAISNVKAELDLRIEKHKKSSDKKDEFNPKDFWKCKQIKELEETLMDTFGFRSAIIEPFVEKYDVEKDVFESNTLNAYISNIDRYPIEGILTDKGFFDKSKSTYIHIVLSLGLMRKLEAEEIMAVLLHEFGHGIDPALVTISYTDTNVLTKYLTDRKSEFKKAEKERFHAFEEIGLVIFGVLFYMGIIQTISKLILPIINWIKDKFFTKEETSEEKIEKIKELIRKDKDKFTRIDMAEAYADNFARMYGYGPALVKALKKLSKPLNDSISRIEIEKDREVIIVEITTKTIKDEHKTKMHRIMALIKEYEEDIKNKTIPEKIRKQLEEDKKELEILLEEYTTNFTEFQNRVNKAIIDELRKKDKKKKKKEAKTESD